MARLLASADEAVHFIAPLLVLVNRGGSPVPPDAQARRGQTEHAEAAAKSFYSKRAFFLIPQLSCSHRSRCLKILTLETSCNAMHASGGTESNACVA
eukprot:6180028-Pleurochrysis_carterae.AAC.1